MKTIDVKQLQEWIENQRDFQLIDVREAHELEIASIGGLHIPLGEVPLRINEFRDDVDVVVYCRSGKRSANAIHHVEEVKGLENLYNLEGGILDWADQIDNTITKY